MDFDRPAFCTSSWRTVRPSTASVAIEQRSWVRQTRMFKAQKPLRRQYVTTSMMDTDASKGPYVSVWLMVVFHAGSI